MFVPLADIVTAGSKASSLSMGFSALPGVFAQMPLGDFFGGLFFFLLFLAAVTSSLSMLQPVIAMFEEGLGLDRKGSVAILGLITLLGSGFVVYFSNNLMALDTMDFWIGSFALFVLATIQVILFGWVLGVDKGLAELDRGAACRLPRWLGFQMKYITPLFLLIIFGFWVSKQLNFAEGGRIMQAINDPVARNTMIFMGVLVIFLALVVNIAIRRWRKDEALANTPFQREIQ
jgi:SNF family Na+-dependent transporter